MKWSSKIQRIKQIENYTNVFFVKQNCLHAFLCNNNIKKKIKDRGGRQTYDNYHFVFNSNSSKNKEILSNLLNFGIKLDLNSEKENLYYAQCFAAWMMQQEDFDAHLASDKDIEVYFCGPPLMNQAVEKMAEDFGVPPENVRFDDFGGQNSCNYFFN